MTEEHAHEGGPSWMRHASAGDAPAARPDAEPEPPVDHGAVSEPGSLSSEGSPSASAAPAAVYVGVIEDVSVQHRPPTPDYSRHAVRPLVYGIVALVSLISLAAVRAWATSGDRDPGERDALETLDGIWYTLNNLLLPQDRTQLPSGRFEVVVLLVVGSIAIAATAIWVGRLGRNVAVGGATFGSGLALLALPAWWTFPLTAGMLHQGPSIRIDELLRLGAALVLLVLQLLLFRWSLVNKVWRAGRIPGDQGALVLWVPELIPWAMLLGSTMAVTMDDGGAADAGWRPTQAMADWGYATSLATMVGIIGLLVVVTIRQQIGIGRDRRRDAEAREFASNGSVLSGPADSST